MSRRFNRIKSN